MDAKPYLLWSESRLSLMRERMVAEMAVWHGRWLKAGNELFSSAVTLDVKSGISVENEHNVWSFENGQRCLARVSFNPGSSFESLCLKMIDAPARPKRSRQGSGVAGSIGQNLLADLIEPFLNFKSGLEPQAAWRRVDADDDDVLGSRALTIGLAGNGVELLLRFPSESIAGLMPSPVVRPKPALSPLLQATNAAVVPIRVSLEASEQLTLEALENLAVGDILMLDQSISKTWTVAGPDGVVLAACTPGRVGSRYAVQILGPG